MVELIVLALSIFRDIYNLLKGMQPDKRQTFARDLHAAFEKAKKEGDTSAIEDLIRRG